MFLKGENTHRWAQIVQNQTIMTLFRCVKQQVRCLLVRDKNKSVFVPVFLSLTCKLDANYIIFVYIILFVGKDC